MYISLFADDGSKLSKHDNSVLGLLYYSFYGKSAVMCWNILTIYGV
jgi:hypothetical protein